MVVSYSNTEALHYWTPLSSIKAHGVQRNPAEIAKARSVCWLHLAFTTGEPKQCRTDALSENDIVCLQR